MAMCKNGVQMHSQQAVVQKKQNTTAPDLSAAVVTDESALNAKDGSISDPSVTPAMEYSTDDGTTWKPVAEVGIISGLCPLRGNRDLCLQPNGVRAAWHNKIHSKRLRHRRNGRDKLRKRARRRDRNFDRKRRPALPVCGRFHKRRGRRKSCRVGAKRNDRDLYDAAGKRHGHGGL